jgi:hypothetical protein
MADIKRTAREIEDVIDIAADRQERGETYRAMSFEEGVESALQWVIGNSTEHPFDED